MPAQRVQFVYSEQTDAGFQVTHIELDKETPWITLLWYAGIEDESTENISSHF